MQWRQAWRGCALDAPFRHQQGALIHRRIPPLAYLLAVLVVAWIPLDLAGLQPREFQSIAVIRLLLAAMLGVLAWNARRLPPLTALVDFIVLQAVGFGAMQACLNPGGGALLNLGYGLFAFVLTVELAIFPLAWPCVLRLAIPVSLLVVVPLASGAMNVGPMLWNTLWLLSLLLALAAWASHAQLALMRELLLAQRDAGHDALTGLLNRRAAADCLLRERGRALRQHAPLSVLMLDIDHFKRINDRWGHAAGDGVLLALADVLRQELRTDDVAVRHGGEEFLVVLPTTTPARAIEVAERIRTQIARQVATPDGSDHITVSIGLASFDGAEGTDALLTRADAAMYRAKQAGRDRCVVAAVPEPSAGLAPATLDPGQCEAATSRRP